MEERFSNEGGGADRGLNPSAPLLFARLEQYFSSIGGAVKGERLENNFTAARQPLGFPFLENKRAPSSGIFASPRTRGISSFVLPSRCKWRYNIFFSLLLDFREMLFYRYPVKSKRLKLLN